MSSSVTDTSLRVCPPPVAAKDDFLLLRKKANWVRGTVLKMAVGANSGHVTTAFSLTEIFLALYHGVLRFDASDLGWAERDRFILSEGQAGIGLYPVLADAGFFPVSELATFVKEGSTLGVHAEPQTPGIQVLTGSLGHGLPIATGMADAGKQDGAQWLVFCLTGDGELSEGSNWEAMITAHTHNLSNLVVIVNRNRHFTIGATDRRETQRDVVLDPIDEKFRSFGFDVRAVNGHSFGELYRVFEDVRTRPQLTDRPLAVIADTEKGHGTSFAGQRGWHYRVPKGRDLALIEAQLEEEGRTLGVIAAPRPVAVPEAAGTQQVATPLIIGMRDAYFKELYKIFRQDKNTVLLSADNGAPTIDAISELPGQFRNVGIAEQQMIGMACGLALEGRRVWVYAIDPFVTFRCLEFIKLDMCAMDLPIVALGVGAGYAYDIMGPTHHAVGAVATMRVWPNLKVYSVADSVTAAALAPISYEDRCPQYIRFDRAGIPDLYHDRTIDFREGLVCAKPGTDIYIVAHGIMVHQALKIADILSTSGIEVGVIDLFRLKPVNTPRLLEYLQSVPRVVSLEEDYLQGGMGSILAEIIVDHGLNLPLLRIGQGDRFVFDLGGREAIWRRYGLDVSGNAAKITEWASRPVRAVRSV